MTVEPEGDREMRVTRGGVRALGGSALILMLAACGSGGGASTQPARSRGTADVAAYCTAKKAFETAPDPDVDFGSASPKELAAAGKKYAASTLRPIFDDILASAPVEVWDASKVIDEGITELEQTGNFRLFNAPEFAAAQATTHAFDRDHCGWGRVDVTATDYAFSGIPDEVEPGTVSFDLTNRSGDEIHEMAIFKKRDGVTTPIQALLESAGSAEKGAGQDITLVGQSLASPGHSGYVVLDLVPGNYAVVCSVHVGATAQNPKGNGPMHYTKGMLAEFAVR
jgi:hypothetical protein